MERLSEELLDHIVSEVTNPLPSRHKPLYNDLLSLSLVSRKFCRIVEPYIYRSLIMTANNGEKMLRTTNTRSELLRHVRAVFVEQYCHVADEIRDFIMHKLILGANATMAYIRSRRPHLTFLPPEAGTSLSQQDLDDTLDSVWLIVERFWDQLDLVLHVKEEPED